MFPTPPAAVPLRAAPKGRGYPLFLTSRKRTSQPRRSFRRPPPVPLRIRSQRGGGMPSFSRHGKEPASRAATSAARRRPSPHSLPKEREYPSLSRHGKEPASRAAASAARRRPSPRRPQREGEHAPSFASRKRTSQPRRSFRRPSPSLSAPPQRGGGTPPLPRRRKLNS